MSYGPWANNIFNVPNINGLFVRVHAFAAKFWAEVHMKSCRLNEMNMLLLLIFKPVSHKSIQHAVLEPARIYSLVDIAIK